MRRDTARPWSGQALEGLRQSRASGQAVGGRLCVQGDYLPALTVALSPASIRSARANSSEAERSSPAAKRLRLP
jgi:hypothetical protein